MDKRLIMDMLLKTEAIKSQLGYTLVAHSLLKGTQTVLLMGNKAYYSPDMAAGEVKVIKIPELSFEPPSMNLEYCNTKPTHSLYVRDGRSF